MATGLSYFNYAAEQIKENAYKAAELAKAKAEEHRLNEHAGSAASGLMSWGSYFKEQATGTLQSVSASAQDGTLADKTKENTVYAATKASEMLSGIGSSLLTRVKATTYKEEEKDHKKDE